MITVDPDFSLVLNAGRYSITNKFNDLDTGFPPSSINHNPNSRVSVHFN